jgi:tRNA 5-methylaminomethyl-2-thiouridine biosynthesis bifunctional protein
MAETPVRIVPAVPAFDAAGTPYAPAYGDVYHSADSGPGQARHVFLGGNALPARWAHARAFTIVETGFGLGLNFLATWDAWRADSARPGRLHFVSIEKHPFAVDGLAELHARYPGLAPLAALLRKAWPPLLPGLHRLHFDDGRVMLTLAFADALAGLRELHAGADAFFLDGFAPARNPDMWSGPLLKALARLAHPGATLATYTTARAVREALAAAGFACELKPGFGRKRHMLTARFAPRWPRRHVPPSAPAWPERKAMIVGAGLAGAAVAERLAARGWAVELVERRDAPAREASGLSAGILHPLVATDDSVLARLTRAGFLYALDRWQALAGHGFEWMRCGVLQLARDAHEEDRMRRALAVLGAPADHAEFLVQAAAAQRAGVEVAAGGIWFPRGGWARPASLVTAQLAAARGHGAPFVLHAGREVAKLVRDADCWRATAHDGATIAAAPLCVLANGQDAARLARFHGPPLKLVRGQLTRLPRDACGALGTVLAGAGFLVPAGEGAIAGASYDMDDGDAAPRAESHAANLRRIVRMLARPAGVDAAALAGEVGFRCVAADRLPLIGAAPDLAAARAAGARMAGAHLADVPRLPGLYCATAYASRGLTWAALGGELIASLAEGEPLPLEGRLADAIDPARFLLHAARRGRL